MITLRRFRLTVFFKLPVRNMLSALLLFTTSIFPAAIKADDAQAEAGGYNLVLVVVSALRADHLGFYGYSRDTSPNIDKLAQESAVFNQAISQSYWTLPSIASIFTSKFVSAHGVDSRDKRLVKGEVTLAEVLKLCGYSTAAFACGLDTAGTYGLAQGFDTYYSYTGKGATGSASEIIEPALMWLKKHKEKKFFMFLQSYDVHAPYGGMHKDYFYREYDGPLKGIDLTYSLLKGIRNGRMLINGIDAELGAQDKRYIAARYDAGIRYADGFLGRLIGEIKNLGLYGRTIIVFCSDHGEELGERGGFDRFGNQNLYQETIRVPLMIRMPEAGFSGRRLDSLAELVDIGPTVLEAMGIPAAHSMQGRSLMPLLKGEGKGVNKYAYSEASGDKWAIISDEGMKLVYSAGKRQLYDLRQDPNETSDISEIFLDKQVRLLEEFFSWRKNTERAGAGERIKLDAAMIERLKRAGYWP